MPNPTDDRDWRPARHAIATGLLVSVLAGGVGREDNVATLAGNKLPPPNVLRLPKEEPPANLAKLRLPPIPAPQIEMSHQFFVMVGGGDLPIPAMEKFFTHAARKEGVPKILLFNWASDSPEARLSYFQSIARKA